MIIKQLYENVKLTAPDAHEHEFLIHLDTAARALIARYGAGYVLLKGESYIAPRSRDGELPIFEEYFSALRDQILYLLGGDEHYKADFFTDADQAYLAVWRRKARGVGFRDIRYNDHE